MYYQFKLNGYTFQDLLALNRVTAKRYRRRITAAVRVVLFIAGLVMLGLGVLFFLEGLLLEGVSSFPGGVLTLLGLIYLGLSIFYYRFNAWHSSRLQIKDTGEITVTLDDAGVREHSRKGDAFYPYSSFIGCFHSRGRYFLFMDKKHAVILPEGSVAVGAPASLGAKLAEKFGGSIQEA